MAYEVANLSDKHQQTDVACERDSQTTRYRRRGLRGMSSPGLLPASGFERSCRWRGKSTQLDLRGRGIGFDDARYSLRTRQIWPY
jgi:hypothetical protein